MAGISRWMRQVPCRVSEKVVRYIHYFGLFGLTFSIVGTVFSICGFPMLFLSQVPVMTWFLWNARDLEKKRMASGKEWLEMRQFRLEMADQYR